MVMVVVVVVGVPLRLTLTFAKVFLAGVRVSSQLSGIVIHAIQCPRAIKYFSGVLFFYRRNLAV